MNPTPSRVSVALVCQRMPKSLRLNHKEKGKWSGLRHRNRGAEPFKPGDVVRLTGIYEIIHDAEHRTAHEAIMHAGDLFPACDVCDERVRFRVVRTAPYIFEDEDFEPER